MTCTKLSNKWKRGKMEKLLYSNFVVCIENIRYVQSYFKVLWFENSLRYRYVYLRASQLVGVDVYPDFLNGQ